MESLDNILSGQGEAAPAPVIEEKRAETVTQTSEAATPPAPTEPADDVSEQPDGRKMVPLEALTEARGKTKRYTEQVADLDKTVNGLQQTVKGVQEQNGVLQRQLGEVLQRIPVPQQQPQPEPDFYENPRAATQHLVAPQFEQFNQQLLAIAKDNAIVRFTEEKVNEAERSFITAMNNRTIDPADYHKVVNSPNRYAAAVQWHQRQLAQAEIGDDPSAYKAKVEAEILEKYGIKDGQAPPAPAPVMPSNLSSARNVGNRSGPAWAGPTPLTDIFKR